MREPSRNINISEITTNNIEILTENRKLSATDCCTSDRLPEIAIWRPKPEISILPGLLYRLNKIIIKIPDMLVSLMIISLKISS